MSIVRNVYIHRRFNVDDEVGIFLCLTCRLLENVVFDLYVLRRVDGDEIVVSVVDEFIALDEDIFVEERLLAYGGGQTLDGDGGEGLVCDALVNKSDVIEKAFSDSDILSDRALAPDKFDRE